MKKQTATTNSDMRMLELRQELWDTARELRYAYARFNFITDPGLIDAGIYDINALKSRYDFLLRKMKALQGRPLEQRKSSPLPAEPAWHARGEHEWGKVMSVVEKIALGLTLLFLVVVCLRLFAAPLKLALKVAFNSALGFGALWLLNLTTSVTGLSLGLSWFNAIVIGILGVPGFGLLLLVQWVLT